MNFLGHAAVPSPRPLGAPRLHWRKQDCVIFGELCLWTDSSPSKNQQSHERRDLARLMGVNRSLLALRPPPGQGHPGRACSHSSSRNGHRESPTFQNNQAFLLSHRQPGRSYFCQTQVPNLFLPSLEASRARALPLFLLATCEWTEIQEPLFFWRGTTIFGKIASSLSSPRLAMKYTGLPIRLKHSIFQVAGPPTSYLGEWEGNLSCIPVSQGRREIQSHGSPGRFREGSLCLHADHRILQSLETTPPWNQYRRKGRPSPGALNPQQHSGTENTTKKQTSSCLT